MWINISKVKKTKGDFVVVCFTTCEFVIGFTLYISNTVPKIWQLGKSTFSQLLTTP